jgi:hypothetical protein
LIPIGPSRPSESRQYHSRDRTVGAGPGPPTIILCTEHLRMLLRLSRESNPGPPALYAKSHSISILVAIRDLSLSCYSSPPSSDGCDSVACSVRVEIRPNASHCMRIAHHVRVTTMQGLDQGHLHPLHRASENVASQAEIEPGSSCTAGEHSMQRAIRMAS